MSISAAVALLLVAGCASENPAPIVDRSATYVQPDTTQSSARKAGGGSSTGSYLVVRGDTLYAIAFRHGLDYREVAAWNNIQPPYRIYVGQQLRLGPDAATASREPAPVAPRSPAPASAPSIAPAVAPTPASSASPATASRASAAASGSMFEDVPAGAPAPEPPVPPNAAPTVSAPKPVEAAAVPIAAPSAKTAVSVSDPAPAPAVRSIDTAASNVGGILWRWPGKGSLVGNFVVGDQTRQGIDIAGTSGDPVLAAADGEVVYSGNGLLGYGELIIIKHNAAFLSAYGHNRKRLVQEGERIKAGQQIAEMGSSASARDELHFEIRKNGKPVNPLDFLPAR